jgi:hypothetical protein
MKAPTKKPRKPYKPDYKFYLVETRLTSGQIAVFRRAASSAGQAISKVMVKNDADAVIRCQLDPNQEP